MKTNISKGIQEAIRIIDESNNIFIASHVNPDGDNLGSQLSLYLGLKKIGKNVYPLVSDFVPDDFLFLPGAEDIVEYSEDLGEIDLFILVDSSDEKRLGDNIELLDKSKKIINIDHHDTNTLYGDVNIVNSEAPATAELIYALLKAMEIELDKDIATNIYTGINTDTGKFSYSGVTSNTHRIAADLLEHGVDITDIDVRLNQSMSMAKMRLFIEAMKSLETYEDNTIATVKATQKMLEQTGATMEDTNGLVEFIRQIKGLEVACLLKEIKKNEIKVSIRSKKYCDVAKVCESFGGISLIRARKRTI